MPNPTRLLLVEQDRDAGSLAAALRTLEHQVQVASMPEALSLARTQPFDAILIDDATAVSRLRGAGLLCPILVLSSSAGIGELVGALDAGADEYIPRPAHPGEVAARIRALMRRVQPQQALQITVENLTLKLLQREAYVRGRPLRCTPKEFEILLRLIRQPRTPVSRPELLRTVWAPSGDSNSNVVEVHMSRLRAKLRDAGADVTITAVRGAGFQLSRLMPARAAGDHADVA